MFYVLLSYALLFVLCAMFARLAFVLWMFPEDCRRAAAKATMLHLAASYGTPDPARYHGSDAWGH